MKSHALHLLDIRGTFQLFSEKSNTTSRAALYTIQQGALILFSYVCKRLPWGAANYSMAELEPLGLYVIINRFKNILAKVDFHCTLDHLPLTYIVKSKIQL